MPCSTCSRCCECGTPEACGDIPARTYRVTPAIEGPFYPRGPGRTTYIAAIVALVASVGLLTLVAALTGWLR